MYFFLFYYSLCFKVYFVWVLLHYLFIAVGMKYLFSVLSLSVCVSLALIQISWRQQIENSCFFIQSATLYLSVRVFSLLIINTWSTLISRYLWFYCFLVVFKILCEFLFVSFLLFRFVFQWLYVCSFLFCASVVGFWFVVTMGLVYIDLKVYLLVLNW